MLSYMRKNATSWAIKVLLGIIVLVFVFWGIGSFGQRPMGRVATVNGEVITQGQYSQMYKRLVQFYERQFQGRLDRETEKKLDISGRALSDLVDSRLWDQKAREMGLSVSPEELAANIASQPIFWSGGRFSPARYQQVLRQWNYSGENFEDEVRAAMLHDKLLKTIAPNAHLSSTEAKNFAAWAKREMNVYYVAFDPSRYTEVEATDQEAKTYYDAHKEDYRTDPMVKVSYLLFRPQDYAKDVQVTDQQKRAYYEDHLTEYEVPRTVEARHILIKVAQDASDTDVEAARTKAADLAARAKAGEDFAELAKLYSEDTSAPKGGDLGAIEKKAVVKPFGDKAFSMEAGEISDPVRTLFGWHVIKVEKINDERVKSYEEAAPGIEEEIRTLDAKDRALEAADKGLDTCLGSDTLDKAAATLHKKALQTAFFPEVSPPPTVPSPMEFAGNAFELPQNEYSSVLDFPEGYCIMQVDATKPSAIPPFDEVKARVLADVKIEKRRKMAEDAAGKMLAELKAGKNLETLAGEDGITVKETGFFTRTGSIPGIGQESELRDAAFLLTTKNPYPEKPVVAPDAVYVIAYAGANEPDEKALAADAEQAAKTLTQGKENALAQSITESLRAKARIEYEPKFAPKTEKSADET
ncbi:MAG: SurA N-terminal domain-containing protein [Thermodesulfobacteriota bacterium]